MILGYARVSTDDQKLEAQFDALKLPGAEKIFADKISGAKRARPELDRALDHLRKGDALVVTKYDRLARSLKDLLEIVDQIKDRGAGFRSLAEDIDTTTARAISSRRRGVKRAFLWMFIRTLRWLLQLGNSSLQGSVRMDNLLKAHI